MRVDAQQRLPSGSFALSPRDERVARPTGAPSPGPTILDPFADSTHVFVPNASSGYGDGVGPRSTAASASTAVLNRLEDRALPRAVSHVFPAVGVLTVAREATQRIIKRTELGERLGRNVRRYVRGAVHDEPSREQLLTDAMAWESERRGRLAHAIDVGGAAFAGVAGLALLTPPVAVTGVAVGLGLGVSLAGWAAPGVADWILGGGVLPNAYDVFASSVLHHIEGIVDERCLCLLLRRHLVEPTEPCRAEIWAYCRALRERDEHDRSGPLNDALHALERKLLEGIDRQRAEPTHRRRLVDDLGHALLSHQVALSIGGSTAAWRPQLGSDAVYVRNAAFRSLERCLNDALIVQGTADPEARRVAVSRALTAAMSDFDLPLYTSVVSAVRRYIVGDQSALAPQDLDKYRNYHFHVQRGQVCVERGGILHVRDENDARPTWVPYIRRVRLSTDPTEDTCREELELLTERYYTDEEGAANRLPLTGKTKPC